MSKRAGHSLRTSYGIHRVEVPPAHSSEIRRRWWKAFANTNWTEICWVFHPSMSVFQQDGLDEQHQGAFTPNATTICHVTRLHTKPMGRCDLTLCQASSRQATAWQFRAFPAKNYYDYHHNHFFKLGSAQPEVLLESAVVQAQLLQETVELAKLILPT